ncbi:MAG: hypothetical protein ACJ8KO_00635, partial [Sulfurifustaceae bacterium]
DGFVAPGLGPGDSVVSALIAAAHGARRTYLIDSGSYATTSMSLYHAATGNCVREFSIATRER